VGRVTQALGEDSILKTARASEEGQSLFSLPGVGAGGGNAAGACLFSLSLFSSSLINLSLLLPPQQKQNTCVDACNGLQPPAWHVDARQLAW